MNKKSLSLTAVTLVLVSFGLALIPVLPAVSAEAPGAWTATTSYPVSLLGSSCATDGSYIYCVGGDSGGLIDSVYSAPLSSSGIGSWTAQTSYPTNVYLPSCAISGGYIYCVGGLVAADTNTNAVYYAQLTAGTVGTWKSGTDYPTNIEAESCVISGGYITCVAGLTVPSFVSTITNAVSYAPISSSGVGTWTSTTNYPITDNLLACSVSGSYIFCMGGEYNMSRGFSTAAVYSDSISSGTVGATWSSTTPYPSVAESGANTCAAFDGYLYCVSTFGLTGEAVNYAAITSGTLGTWTAGPDYPIYVETNQVVITGCYIYGVGGETANAYYSQISCAVTSSSSASSSSSSSSISSSSSTSTSASTTTSTAPPTSSASTTSSKSTSTISIPPSSTTSIGPTTSFTSISISTATNSTSTSSTGVGVPQFSFGAAGYLVFLVAMISLVLVFNKARTGRSPNSSAPVV